ncbi:MAG: hypothetical protein ACOCRK_06600 [bacterium]
MILLNNFQREGSISNAHVGTSFEDVAQKYFKTQGLYLKSPLTLHIGVNDVTKPHSFDLGDNKNRIIVECKSHKWTTGGNVPSAKLTVWNEAMYYFLLAPNNYRKIFFILKDVSLKRNETLGQYYIRRYNHLIPESVEILEYDTEINNIKVLLK